MSVIHLLRMQFSSIKNKIVLFWRDNEIFTQFYVALNEMDSRSQMKRGSNSFRPEPNNISEKQIADIHLPWQRFGTRIFDPVFPSFEKFVGFLRTCCCSSQCSYP